MKNGGIILTAIALMFAGIYIYSYSFDYFQRLKEDRKLKRRIKMEASINEHKALNEKAREEKFKKLADRSREIKEELNQLEEFKNNIQERHGKKAAF